MHQTARVSTRPRKSKQCLPPLQRVAEHSRAHVIRSLSPNWRVLSKQAVDGSQRCIITTPWADAQGGFENYPVPAIGRIMQSLHELPLFDRTGGGCFHQCTQESAGLRHPSGTPPLPRGTLGPGYPWRSRTPNIFPACLEHVLGSGQLKSGRRCTLESRTGPFRLPLNSTLHTHVDTTRNTRP